MQFKLEMAKILSSVVQSSKSINIRLKELFTSKLSLLQISFFGQYSDGEHLKRLINLSVNAKGRFQEVPSHLKKSLFIISTLCSTALQTSVSVRGGVVQPSHTSCNYSSKHRARLKSISSFTTTTAYILIGLEESAIGTESKLLEWGVAGSHLRRQNLSHPIGRKKREVQQLFL